MTLPPPLLSLLLPVLFLAGCGARSPVVSTSGLLPPPTAPPPGAPAIALLPFDDEREEFHHPGRLALVPVAGLFSCLDPTVTSHPERRIVPVLEEPLGVFLPRALEGALGSEAHGIGADFLPLRPGEEVPISYDYVLHGRILAVEARVAGLDYGLNAFRIVDLSLLPHALGAPVRVMEGSISFEVELRERFSGRLVHRETVEWASGRVWEWVYTAPDDSVVHRFHRALVTDAMEGLAARLAAGLEL